jgi:hypothetical protein
MQGEASTRLGFTDYFRVEVTSRMHCEHVPTSAIEPGDKNQFIARSDALQPFEDFRFEHQPRCRRAFVGLSGADSGCVSGDSTLPIAVTAKLVMTRLSAAHVAAVPALPTPAASTARSIP